MPFKKVVKRLLLVRGLACPQSFFWCYSIENNFDFAFQRKEAEANGSASQVQNGYYDPNNPNFAYVPPPAYNEMPPSYSDSNKKND